MADYSKLTKRELIMTLYARDSMIEERRKNTILLEKALELACDKIEHIFESDYSTAWFYAEDNKTIIERDKFEDYFKTKAKEIMKSE